MKSASSESIELKLKVALSEKELAQQELKMIREELDAHKESVINTEKECYDKQMR